MSKRILELNKYSYHQINVFIELFIFQYNKFERKLSFISEGKDVIEQSIKDLDKCTHYLTNGGFEKLVLIRDKLGKINYIYLLK